MISLFEPEIPVGQGFPVGENRFSSRECNNLSPRAGVREQGIGLACRRTFFFIDFHKKMYTLLLF